MGIVNISRVARSSSTTTDYIYLTTTSLLSSCSTCPPLGSSDHRSLQLSLNWSKCPQKTVSCRIWNYLRADWDAICSDLVALPSPIDDVDSSWVSWKSHFIRTLSHYIPTKVCRVKKSLPWMSPNLFKLFHKCDITFSIYKATKSECHLSRYMTFHNKSLVLYRKLSVSSSIDFLHSSCLLSSSGLCITHS